MDLLLIDNYDSFTYNVVQLCKQAGVRKVIVVKNDELSVDSILQFEHIIISPGPKIPEESGCIIDVLRQATTQKILGICLGHQALAQAYGFKLYNLKNPRHGLCTQLNIQKQFGLFENIPQHSNIGLYHSWAVDTSAENEHLELLATDTAGVNMALKHKQKLLFGVQFHIESYMTPIGNQILHNWLHL